MSLENEKKRFFDMLPNMTSFGSEIPSKIKKRLALFINGEYDKLEKELSKNKTKTLQNIIATYSPRIMLKNEYFGLEEIEKSSAGKYVKRLLKMLYYMETAPIVEDIKRAFSYEIGFGAIIDMSNFTQNGRNKVSMWQLLKQTFYNMNLEGADEDLVRTIQDMRKFWNSDTDGSPLKPNMASIFATKIPFMIPDKFGKSAPFKLFKNILSKKSLNKYVTFDGENRSVSSSSSSAPPKRKRPNSSIQENTTRPTKKKKKNEGKVVDFMDAWRDENMSKNSMFSTLKDKLFMLIKSMVDMCSNSRGNVIWTLFMKHIIFKGIQRRVLERRYNVLSEKKIIDEIRETTDPARLQALKKSFREAVISAKNNYNGKVVKYEDVLYIVRVEGGGLYTCLIDVAEFDTNSTLDSQVCSTNIRMSEFFSRARLRKKQSDFLLYTIFHDSSNKPSKGDPSTWHVSYDDKVKKSSIPLQNSILSNNGYIYKGRGLVEFSPFVSQYDSSKKSDSKANQEISYEQSTQLHKRLEVMSNTLGKESYPPLGTVKNMLCLYTEYAIELFFRKIPYNIVAYRNTEDMITETVRGEIYSYGRLNSFLNMISERDNVKFLSEYNTWIGKNQKDIYDKVNSYVIQFQYEGDYTDLEQKSLEEFYTILMSTIGASNEQFQSLFGPDEEIETIVNILSFYGRYINKRMNEGDLDRLEYVDVIRDAVRKSKLRIPSITFLYRVRYNYVSTTSGKLKTIMRTSTDYSSIVNHLETTASSRPISDVQIVEYDTNGDEYQIRYNVQTFDSDTDDFP